MYQYLSLFLSPHPCPPSLLPSLFIHVWRTLTIQLLLYSHHHYVTLLNQKHWLSSNLNYRRTKRQEDKHHFFKLLQIKRGLDNPQQNQMLK